jgi:hypothetical protein
MNNECFTQGVLRFFFLFIIMSFSKTLFFLLCELSIVRVVLRPTAANNIILFTHLHTFQFYSLHFVDNLCTSSVNYDYYIFRANNVATFRFYFFARVALYIVFAFICYDWQLKINNFAGWLLNVWEGLIL